MSLTAEIHIDKPPRAFWRDDRMHFEITSGDISFTRILTRHAAVGLFMELQRELAKQEGVSPRELCLRIADG